MNDLAPETELLDKIVVTDDEEVEPVTYDTLEDAEAALGAIPVDGPESADFDLPLGDEDE